jgi:recombinational DNA repair ATPase RecF
MEVRVETLEAAGRELAMTEQIHNRARALHTLFLQSRDSILTHLYNSIRDRFVELYLSIHRDHESDFKAELEPDNAGVRLTVGFYDQGLFPPHAVHSEGHQDSMGICLFLALSELFASKALGIVALDDVMMSVDGEHRRAASRLLKEEFPNTQFVITTHDRSWARQLRTDGVVKPKHSVHFSGWNLQTGPHVDGDTDAWHECRQLLESDRVAQAEVDPKIRTGG